MDTERDAGRKGESMRIDDWRRKIDAIDTAMLHLLNLRAELSVEVGRMKHEEGVALRAPAREQEIISRMKETNLGPLDSTTIERIYQLILDESIRTQERHGFGTPFSPKPSPSAAGGNHPKPGRRWRK
jgi:chorismate mutase/prephenate dehydratase